MAVFTGLKCPYCDTLLELLPNNSLIAETYDLLIKTVNIQCRSCKKMYKYVAKYRIESNYVKKGEKETQESEKTTNKENKK